MQVPDRRNGWHTVSLREAMKGPGQLLGRVDVDTQGYTDVWSNHISDLAIQARRQEDVDEAAAWQATKIAKGWTAGLPAGSSAADTEDFAIGTRREAARNARIYEGILNKRGAGTLFLTGNETWHGDTNVLGGKLSVVGSHASPIYVQGGTLGGSGSVAGYLDVSDGVLEPGLYPAEAAAAGTTDVPVAAGNLLSVGGDVRIVHNGALAITVRSASAGDYTSVQAAGDVVLGGALAVLDVARALPPGTVLTILSGRSITGTFRALPNKETLFADDHLFRVNYEQDRVTLTVVASGEAFRAQQAAEKAAFDAQQAAALAAFEAKQAAAGGGVRRRGDRPPRGVQAASQPAGAEPVPRAAAGGHARVPRPADAGGRGLQGAAAGREGGVRGEAGCREGGVPARRLLNRRWPARRLTLERPTTPIGPLAGGARSLRQSGSWATGCSPSASRSGVRPSTRRRREGREGSRSTCRCG